MIVVLVVLGLGFLFFIIHTIRCYFTKSAVDDDEDNEFRVRYEGEGGRPQPI